jgi:biopolymer transport protein ExbB/TolQ
MKAIENVGLIEMAGLESGLVWLATVSNVAPLLGFLGTVLGMIAAFTAIEAAGEVEATIVAGGIKIALITTATGLAIAIPDQHRAQLLRDPYRSSGDRHGRVGPEDGRRASRGSHDGLTPCA